MTTDEVLTRGVDEIFPSKTELENLLKSGKKLRVYQGFDPSSANLHIGHMIGLRKLRQWQDLGHEVIFLIGDFTGMIGDPTGREETRPVLSKETVENNAKTYKEQAGKILDFTGSNPVKIKFNSEWLGKLKTPEIVNLFSKITYQQIIKRGMFKKRLENDGDISFGEVTYPILQGYDSVAMDIDIEVGGRDQLFNMMIGRDLMHKMKRKNKFVITTQLLEDNQGSKIGKTEGNAISFTDKPEQIYGAIMNFPDDTITKCLECLTDVPSDKIKEAEKAISSGKNPLEFKKLLASEVVKQLDGEKEAQNAQQNFENTVQKGQTPEDILEIKVEDNATVIDVVSTQVDSISEAKRLISQNAIEMDGQTITDPKTQIKSGQVIKIGKKKFVRIK